MGFATVLGKTLIVAAILFQAWLLYQDKKEGDEFNKNLSEAIAGCSCCESIRPHLEKYLRLVVVGLLATSALMIICKCWSIKLLTLFGLITLLWVEHHTVFKKVPTLALLDNSPFWHSMGVIGAIIYLMGAECSSCRKAPEGEAKPAEPVSKETKKQKKN